MANRGNEPYERRTRAIYDALDGRNWKAAIKLCTAALAKHKDDQLLRALKTYALLVSGKKEEAVELCDGLLKEVVTDGDALHMLSLTLRQLQREGDITVLYEGASAANPRDEGLLLSLFEAYVRDFNFTKQQQVAVKLQRLHPHDVELQRKYTWWTIVSLALQARAAKTGSGKGMSREQLLQLGQSLAEKRTAAGGSSEGYQAIMFYIYLLQEQGKLGKALEVVSGTLGQAIQLEEERNLLKAELMIGDGMLDAAGKLAGQSWAQNPDDWSSFSIALDCLLPPTKQATDTPLAGAASDKVGEAEALVDSVLSSAADDAIRRRGAILAKVHLRLRQHMLSPAGGSASTSEQTSVPTSNGTPTPSAGSPLASAIVAAFHEIGHTMSCAAELRSCVSKLGPEGRRWLVSQIWSQVEGLDPESQLSHKDVRRLISAYQVESDAGLPLHSDAGSAVDRAKRLMALFRASQHLYGGVDEKDRGPADDLPVLAADALVAAWKLDKSGHPTHLLQAVLLLEHVQLGRKKSSGLRLAAAALYSILGAPLEASKQLAHLDIKHIQHDTLSGHWHLPALIGGACYPEAASTLNKVADLFKYHVRDCGNSLVKAYQHANYTKIVEIVEFKERLDKAVGRASASVESAFLRVRSACHEGLPQALACMQDIAKDKQSQWEGTRFEGLRFNEDLSTRPSWLPPATAGPSLDLAAWWESQPQSAMPGLGDCWWSRTSAAELEVPQAVQYRKECLKSLQRRTLQLQLLTALPPVPPESHASHQEAFRKLLELEGVAEEGLDAWMEGLPPSIPDLRLTQLSHHVTLALLAVTQASEGGDVGCLQLRLKQLQSSFLAASTRLSSELLASRMQGGLPSLDPALVVATTFLQQLSWTAIWLQTWKSTANSQSKGKKSKKAQQNQGSEPESNGKKANGSCDAKPGVALKDSGPQLLEVQQAVVEAARGLKETLSSKLDAAKAAQDLREGLRDAEVFWEGDDKIALVKLRNLIVDQQAQMARLAKEAAVVLERLK